MDINSTRRSVLRICVDSTAHQELSGRVESPLLGSLRFEGILMMITMLERFFDQVRFPQRSFRIRSFSGTGRRPDYKKKEVTHTMDEAIKETAGTPKEDAFTKPGRQATFVVHVRFRQNASWQGSVQWVESGRTQNFRSTLELLSLMEDALAREAGPTITGRWETPASPEE